MLMHSFTRYALVLWTIIAFSASAQAQIRVEARVTTNLGSCASCDLSKRPLNGLKLQDSNFSSSLFNNSNLSGAQIDRSNLSGAHFRKALLLRVMGSDVNLSGANFQDATLTEAILENSNLSDTTFQHADMVRARFNGTNFADANLSGASAINSSFEDCQFPGARLNHANFQNAILRGANFQEADFGYAILEGTDIAGANLSGADLRRVRGLTQAQLDQACGNSETQLPRDFTISTDCTEVQSHAEKTPRTVVKVSENLKPQLSAEIDDLIQAVDEDIRQIDTLLNTLGNDQTLMRRKLQNVRRNMVQTRRTLEN